LLTKVVAAAVATCARSQTGSPTARKKLPDGQQQAEEQADGDRQGHAAVLEVPQTLVVAAESERCEPA